MTTTSLIEDYPEILAPPMPEVSLHSLILAITRVLLLILIVVVFSKLTSWWILRKPLDDACEGS